jgi:ABC-type multidrug transport system ATPase subunit
MADTMTQPSAAADAAAPIIQARGLSHRYPATGRDALQNVDFEVAPASVAGLLGPNDAGKSTLLAILTGITPPQRGSVRVAGRDPRERGWLRGATSLVLQEYAFYEALTRRENLAFLAGVHRLPRAQWQRQLEYCTGVCLRERERGQVLQSDKVKDSRISAGRHVGLQDLTSTAQPPTAGRKT